MIDMDFKSPLNFSPNKSHQINILTIPNSLEVKLLMTCDWDEVFTKVNKIPNKCIWKLKEFFVKNVKHLLIYSKHFIVTKERNMGNMIIYQQK